MKSHARSDGNRRVRFIVVSVTTVVILLLFGGLVVISNLSPGTSPEATPALGRAQQAHRTPAQHGKGIESSINGLPGKSTAKTVDSTPDQHSRLANSTPSDPDPEPESIDPPPPSPPDPLDRKVLRQEDFEYLGAFALPKSACGMSTAFGETGLALRRVGGQLRFLTGSHRYTGDAIYEVAFPGWGKNGKWLDARLVREWGAAVYGDKKRVKGGKEFGWTHGLCFDEVTGRLYFSFGSWYNIPPTNDPALGYALLEEGGPKPFGSWKAPEAKAHCQKIRGGSLMIPKWFADRFTKGRTLGLGFGGYYSGYLACSRGPFLAAAYPPQRENAELDVLPLIDYTDAHWGERDPDYKSDISWSPNPKNGVGYWGAEDEIFGSGAWVDLPDKHGMLFLATMGHGRVWYEASDRQCERKEGWWFVYDPKDLADVARGKKQPWQLKARRWKVPYSPRPLIAKQLVTPGCAFDSKSRTLFVLIPQSYQWGVEWYPLIHGWRVKKS